MQTSHMGSRLTHGIHLTYLFVGLTDFSKINMPKSVSLLLPPHQILIFYILLHLKKKKEDNFIFKLHKPNIFELCLFTLSLIPHSIHQKNHIGIAFKVYSESDQFSPPPLSPWSPPWSPPPVLAWVIQ